MFKRGTTKGGLVFLCVILALMIALSACSKSDDSQLPASGSDPVTGEGSNNGDSSTPANDPSMNPVLAKWGPDVDVSQPVHLVFQLMGGYAPGMEAVEQEISNRLKRDINATIEFRQIANAEVADKYPLALAGGDIDAIQITPRALPADHARKGAYLKLDEDMIKTYMPRKWENIERSAWAMTRGIVDGDLWWVPSSTPNRSIQTAAIRGDLREEYGLPEITQFSEIEPFLDAVKANTGLTPMVLDSGWDLKLPIMYMLIPQNPGFKDLYPDSLGGGQIFADHVTGEIFTLFDEPYKSQFIEAAKTMQRWYDKGFINRDIFGNSVRSKDALIQGGSYVGFGTTVDMQSVLASTDEKGWSVELIPQLNYDGKSPMLAYGSTGMGITNYSKNPERALMALDLLMEDYDYNMLAYFGIEGESWVLNDSGQLDLPDGVTHDTNPYPVDVTGFYWTNKTQHPPRATWTSYYIDFMSEHDPSVLFMPAVAGFEVNKDSISAEVANILSVSQQYGGPIFAGVVNDVEQAVEKWIEELNKVGFGRVVAETKSQIQEYITANPELFK